MSSPAPVPPYSLPNTESAWTQSALTGLREDVRDLGARVDRRLDALEESLGGRINDVDERVRQVEKKMNQWGGGIIAVNALLIIAAILLRVFNVSITIGD